MKPHLLLAALLAVLATSAQAREETQAEEQAKVPVAVTTTWPRLFFTPDERRRVTQQRQATLEGGRLVSAGPAADDGPALAATALRAAPRVDGVSLVSGARFAAWIGGRRVEDGGSWDGYRLRVTRDGVQFIDATGAVRLVKVGQAVRPPGRGAP